MFELMKDGLGVGLAAPRPASCAGCSSSRPMPTRSRRNRQPAIEWLSDETEVAAEGCLEHSRVIVEVDRPLYARVRGQDRNSAEVLIEASGHEARVPQHEIDHLDGIPIPRSHREEAAQGRDEGPAAGRELLAPRRRLEANGRRLSRYLEFAGTVLDILAASDQRPGMVTLPDRRRGRGAGNRLLPSPTRPQPSASKSRRAATSTRVKTSGESSKSVAVGVDLCLRPADQ